MNAETLHAVDALYLEHFLRTLLFQALNASAELCEPFKQAEALSATENLSPDCRSRYAEVTKRLGPLVSELRALVDDLQIGGKLQSEYEPLVQWGLIETIPEHETRTVIERLNLAERELITTLNHIGKSLVSSPEANVSWDSSARVRTYLTLKPIPERPCYQAGSMLRICASPPWDYVCYFTEFQAEANTSCSDITWLLDSDLQSLVLLPLFEDIEIDLEVRGDMIASWHDHTKRGSCDGQFGLKAVRGSFVQSTSQPR